MFATKQYLNLKNKIEMNKEELIQFLRENLKIEVWCGHDACDSHIVEVSLYLGDEEISTSSGYLQ
jgi:hypothetical protein